MLINVPYLHVPPLQTGNAVIEWLSRETDVEIC